VKIELIKSNIFLQKPSGGKENLKPEEQSPKAADSLKISSQGQQLSKILEGGKNLDAISEKINNGYYSSDEVLQKVADAILKEINSK